MRLRFLVGLLLVATSAFTPSQAIAIDGHSEQQGSRGANTFANYHNASGMGERIQPAQWVMVSCKVYDPTIQSVSPDGYWYRIASPPWNNQYYAAANTFMNGDPWGGPFQNNTDFAVPDCGAPPPAEIQQESPVVSLSRGEPAPGGAYRYLIELSGFPLGTTQSVSCADSTEPGGFFSFEVAIDEAGGARIGNQCYSADGPEHWVVVNGSLESNRVTWHGVAMPEKSSTAANEPAPSLPVSPSASASGVPAPACTQYEGTPMRGGGVGGVAQSLYNHYLLGDGATAVIDWDYFARDREFVAFAKSLSINESDLYRADASSNMFYAIGTFTVRRASESCFQILDEYDFELNFASLGQGIQTVTTLPQWSWGQVGIASNFDVLSRGELR